MKLLVPRRQRRRVGTVGTILYGRPMDAEYSGYLPEIECFSPPSRTHKIPSGRGTRRPLRVRTR